MLGQLCPRELPASVMVTYEAVIRSAPANESPATCANPNAARIFFLAILSRELENTVAAKLRREMARDKRIIGIIGRERDGGFKPSMIETHFGVLRQDFTEEGLQPSFAGGLQASPIGRPPE